MSKKKYFKFIFIAISKRWQNAFLSSFVWYLIWCFIDSWMFFSKKPYATCQCNQNHDFKHLWNMKLWNFIHHKIICITKICHAAHYSYYYKAPFKWVNIWQNLNNKINVENKQGTRLIALWYFMTLWNQLVKQNTIKA